MTEDQIDFVLVGRSDKLDRLERALRSIAGCIVPPADTPHEVALQRIIYRQRLIALKALGEEECQ